MNCLAVETEGRVLVVDCGVLFGNDEAGIELLHPGFEYLVSRRDDIEGVVLTHGHEDHLAGVPYLLREIDVPVYGGSYALQLLKSKTAESELNLQPMSRTCAVGETLHLGPFEVTPFAMPHSIIQNTGLLVEMRAGRLLHTGDFKLDIRSADKGSRALNTLRTAAKGGIDLMLCDSTGAEESESAGAESQVLIGLERLFQETHSRIFAAVFSSNIRRIETVLTLSKKYGRKVVLCGRSVQNHFRCASAVSAVDAPTDHIISLDEAVELPRDKVTVLISGTQGEHRSALSRTAAGNHHLLNADPDDLVVLSSRFIPGNELSISRMIDRLLLQGARVIHRGIMPEVHVSGHGGREEIRRAVEAAAPRCFVPIHGTYRHLTACADIAAETGCRQIQIVGNGRILKCDSEGLTAGEIGVPSRRVFVDRGGTLSESAVKERRILGVSGVLCVSAVFDATSVSVQSVGVMSRGVVSSEAAETLHDLISAKAITLAAELDLSRPDPQETLRAGLRAGLRKFLIKQFSREPMVLVTILNG